MGGNQYNEHWTFEQCEKFLKEAVDLSKQKGFDFIGEVAKAQDTYRDVYDYITDKFPQLKHYKKTILRNCETNCFSDGKKGDIVPSLAIMNLKSNHGWTDRVDQTSKGKEINTTPTIVFKKFNKDEPNG
jgi:hypothetical protein